MGEALHRTYHTLRTVLNLGDDGTCLIGQLQAGFGLVPAGADGFHRVGGKLLVLPDDALDLGGSLRRP